MAVYHIRTSKLVVVVKNPEAGITVKAADVENWSIHSDQSALNIVEALNNVVLLSY